MKTLIKNASVLLADGKVKETDIAVDGAKIRNWLKMQQH